MSTFDFLAVDGAVASQRFAPLARTPMEGQALAAGARLQVRDGWNVAVDYGDPDAEREAVRASGAWVDCSPLGKLELQGSREALGVIADRAGDGAHLELGSAARAGGAWWCPLTPERALVLCASGATGELRSRLQAAADDAPGLVSVVEVTTLYAALALCGPPAREIFARFCALDLRPQSCPVGGLRPGSVARTPGPVLCEGEERFLMLFGWALGEYMWTVVADAGRRLGARPAGADALEPLDVAVGETAHGA